ncbi:DUF6304 family protein [Streptomyces sp. NPDC102270]|uniref:DUF6304 family protein n=1 Tax=Streptomyces sp. NPDC102270 TaxID=3366150 RepID=UPI0037FE9549
MRPGRYTDRHGTEEIVFESDGRELIRTTIKGVRFESDSMDDLGALAGEPPEQRGSGVRPGVLRCALRLGDPAGPRRGRDEQTTDVPRKLPRAARMKACISCAWSDYNPVGNGFMPGPARFRDTEDRYRQVDGKHGPTGVFALWQDLTEFVQETWLCPEFEHRGPFPG